MAIRRKPNRKLRGSNNRGRNLKSGHFTRKGTKQVYGKGPQGRKSFPHGILTSEDNYGGYQVYQYGIQCDGADGGGYSEDCNDLFTPGDTISECRAQMWDCEDLGGTPVILSSNNNSGGYNQVYSDGMTCDCGGGTGWSADIDSDVGGGNSFVGLFQSCMAENCTPSLVAN